MLASQGWQAQGSLGSFARSQEHPFVCRSHDFNQNYWFYFPTHYPELFSTVSIFKTLLPFSSLCICMSCKHFMSLAREDCFLNHYHMWQYFLLGRLSLLSFELETEVTYSTGFLGIRVMMDVLFVLIILGLYFRHAPSSSLPGWKLSWVTNTQQEWLRYKLIAGIYSLLFPSHLFPTWLVFIFFLMCFLQFLNISWRPSIVI